MCGYLGTNGLIPTAVRHEADAINAALSAAPTELLNQLNSSVTALLSAINGTAVAVGVTGGTGVLPRYINTLQSISGMT